MSIPPSASVAGGAQPPASEALVWKYVYTRYVHILPGTWYTTDTAVRIRDIFIPQTCSLLRYVYTYMYAVLATVVDVFIEYVSLLIVNIGAVYTLVSISKRVLYFRTWDCFRQNCQQHTAAPFALNSTNRTGNYCCIETSPPAR